MNEASATDNIWEDTVIIAFRDMQWIRWGGELVKQIADGFSDEPATKAIRRPDVAHKLDGKAESRFGDMIAEVGSRFFLFEFKATRHGHSDEHGKSVFERLSDFQIRADTQDDELAADCSALGIDVNLQKTNSQKCHFGVFAVIEPIKADKTPKQKAAGKLIVRDVTLKADCYWDWLLLANKRLAYEEQENSLEDYLKVKEKKLEKGLTYKRKEISLNRKATKQPLTEDEKKELENAKKKFEIEHAKIDDVALRRRTRAGVVLKQQGGKTIPKKPTIDEVKNTNLLTNVVWDQPELYGLAFEDFYGYLRFLLHIQASDGDADAVKFNLVGVDGYGCVALVTLSLADLRHAYDHDVMQKHLERAPNASTSAENKMQM